MPGLCLHINIGNSALEDGSHPASSTYPGSFFLGTTAPDIRTYTGQDRKDTHFFDLDILSEQDPIQGLLTKHPGMFDDLSAVTPQSAFLAGYITHLLADKRYIEQIYRKFFLTNIDSQFDPSDETQMRYNLFDRTLQFELDRIQKSEQSILINALYKINEQEHIYDVPFIDNLNLNDWSKIMMSIVAQPPVYDRYPQLMHSHLSKLGYSSDKILNHLNDYKKNINDTFNIVSQKYMEQFVNETVKISLDTIMEFT
ncbi:MAG: hypothetical protein CL710_05345 [Chloroflexi bacterium]|nr:hypothetical protein [Chloroflexota bacterium]|tara:strand:- start:9344 stop:10108 length:765 start_codon:yes stop_codon:yes gene_type:complete